VRRAEALRNASPALLALCAALALPAFASAHAERPSTWPTYPGSVPQLRKGGVTEVVCKSDSRRRILRLKGALRRNNLALLRRCRFRNIQAAVDKASNNTRIMLLPGVYKEEPSRAQPLVDPRCSGMYAMSAEGGSVPDYNYNLHCPNSRNLIAIMGDTNGDRRCDAKCNIQITGTGRPQDARIIGDRKKLNIIRADRADGIYLANFTIELSDFNNIYVLETNGFHFNHIVSRYSREYGFLSFTSEAGLYENLDTYGNGDSGVYPGSGPQGLASERACKTYGIEIRAVNSHDNNLGYSGTSGDSVYIHDNKFHGNAAGIATDSFAAGHPGSPQHCSKWEHNQIYSNNLNIFTPERQAYCTKPAAERDPKVLCSAFQVPVGTGMLIAGGNKDIVKDNYVWDNWRRGFMLFWVPAYFRNEPEKGVDTSFDNTYTANHMSVRPDGTRDPNGVDFWWDEEGSGNCWQGNVGPGGAKPTSDPATLPACPGSPVYSPGIASKTVFLAPCATWDPQTNQFPPACDWVDTPPEPK